MADRETERIVAEAVRWSRDHALEVAISICEEMASQGAGADSCVKALQDLRAMLPKPPSKTQ